MVQPASKRVVRESTYLTDMAGKQSTTGRGVAGGYAPLDSSGKVPESFIPDGIAAAVAVPLHTIPVYYVMFGSEGAGVWPGGTATTWPRPDDSKGYRVILQGPEGVTFPTAVTSGSAGPLANWDGYEYAEPVVA